MWRILCLWNPFYQNLEIRNWNAELPFDNRRIPILFWLSWNFWNFLRFSILVWAVRTVLECTVKVVAFLELLLSCSQQTSLNITQWILKGCMLWPSFVDNKRCCPELRFFFSAASLHLKTRQLYLTCRGSSTELYWSQSRRWLQKHWENFPRKLYELA